ncbi:MAG: GDSL-type esterase/lipase family protein [Phocaeicola sp.]|uniref:GDSL-type esterase/lipase family protein n=1 Tax=Phocaeicola sp. TaxID=2773926 RepID=UPI003F9F8DB6
MKGNKLLYTVLWLLAPFMCMAQDSIPSTFRGTKENKIMDETHSIDSLFSKLDKKNRQVRIVSIGDSHVRGHVFTYTTRLFLEKSFGDWAVFPDEVTYRTTAIARETGEPGLIFHIFGVNGATAATFNTPENIALVDSLQPDLIIVSFGTNEAHGAYNPTVHKGQMDELISIIKRNTPDAIVLLSTPPGAYKGRGRHRRINPNTQKAAKAITEYAQEKGYAWWDLYNIIGGRQYAVRNWSRARMFTRDGIHFTTNGYQLQGMLLYQAIMKEYKAYGNRMEQNH